MRRVEQRQESRTEFSTTINNRLVVYMPRVHAVIRDAYILVLYDYSMRYRSFLQVYFIVLMLSQ
jgi:hypothetical protein